MKAVVRPILPLALAAALAGCAHNDELDIDSGTVGKRIARLTCPAVAVPTYTGDATLFDPPASRDARAIDVVATITDVKPTCDETATGATIETTVTFRVDARRERAQGARDVTMPYFVSVVRGGTQVESKQLGQVVLRFADGQQRASAGGTAQASVQRAAATLADDVRQQITRKRKPTDADASIDPLADPKVRAAVQRANFEVLVGFQLTQDQLAYNATR